jgi:hypothetical protein
MAQAADGSLATSDLGDSGMARRKKMTKAEARAWMARWQLVNEAERNELQATPPEVKLQQIATLMSWVKPLGWTEALAAEEAEVRERWMRLRKSYRVPRVD